MTEIKYYKVTKITEQELVQAREIATKNNCMVRLLWQPNKYNPEQTISVDENISDDTIDNILVWARGPWGM